MSRRKVSASESILECTSAANTKKKPAKYVVFGINEGTNVAAGNFYESVEQIEKMGKEAVVAVIERRGEVIYYKASKMGFVENRHRLENKE